MRNGSEAEGTLNATNSTRGAKRGHGRGRQPSGPKQGEASCAGLAPDGVYVYAEWGEGRTNRPPCTGSTVATTVTAHWKANQHSASTSSQIQRKAGGGALPRGARFDRLCGKPEWWNGRRSGLKIRGPVIGRTGSSPVSGTRPKLRKYLAQRR